MIEGTKKQEVGFVEQKLYVGLFEGEVVALNPTAEEFKKLTGWTPSENSRQFDYTGTSNDGNPSIRLDFWIREKKERLTDDNKPYHNKFRLAFWIEAKDRENREGTLTQYINDVGTCSWAESPERLPQWFTSRKYRVARPGEEKLYNFLRIWLGKLDTRDADTHLDLNWKPLINGDVSEIRDQIGGEYCRNVLALATIEVGENREGRMVNFQRVYDTVLMPYQLKFFNTEDYKDTNVVARIATKSDRLSPFERFVVDVNDERYGCKQVFTLKPIEEYDPEKPEHRSIVSTDEVRMQESNGISESNADY